MLTEDTCPVHDRPWIHGRNMANAPIGRYCPWDGSMHPDEFMAYCEKPGTLLTPTYKNYKVYIDVLASDAGEDPDELRVIGSSSGGPPTDTPPYPDWTRLEGKALEVWEAEGNHGDYKPAWVGLGPRGDSRGSKFYFEHLSVEQRHQFVLWVNAGYVNLREPGHFNVLPFFMKRGSS